MIIGQRKHHNVPNVAISFVSSVELVPWWRLVVCSKCPTLHVWHVLLWDVFDLIIEIVNQSMTVLIYM